MSTAISGPGNTRAAGGNSSNGNSNSSSSIASECRKFAPNIFNKSKCSSCFKQKEEHTAEALECNRATRKISKCGYLFVAPGWDFNNPLNRTKRWQRRWFVLYDDGELTYSVDEHPETVPQARIDMTRVLEVAAAEDITGHAYSLAVTAPEGVTFVKGTCREETRWWADVLQVYPRNKGRHKRNATFPGGQATILQVPPGVRSNTPNPPRPRFNSCRSEPRVSNSSWIQDVELHQVSKSKNVLGAVNGSSNGSENGVSNSLSPQFISSSSSSSSASSSSSSSTSNVNGVPSSTSLAPVSSPSSSSQTPSALLPCAGVGAAVVGVGPEKPPIAPGETRLQYRDQPASSASPPTRDKLRAEDKARRRMMNQQNAERVAAAAAAVAVAAATATPGVSSPEKLDDEACRRILLEHEREREGKLRDIAASLTQPRIRRNKPRTSEPTRDVVDAANAAHQDKLIRGDPDGCGLDISGTRYSPTSELRVDLPAEDLLNIKKGWLMKQSVNKEWNKHWFVLRGCGLMYYRDPSAEDKGIMDGVIDLNTVTAITPVSVARNYGFQTVTWDDRGTTLLSAVTAGIRSSWMSAIRRAANLPDPDNKCQENEQEPNSESPVTSITDRERDSIVPSTPVTPRSVLFSSDEEYRTASEGGRRESGDWSELPISPPLTRNGDWALSLKGPNWPDQMSHEWSELPPSPPLTRTVLSRVKARSRSSSRSRGYKRSRSSPPSSRRSTLDSVRSEDLMMACCELGEDEEQNAGHLQSNGDNPLIVELLESQVSMLRDQLDQNQAHPSTLLVIIERQESEIEDLKSQLSDARGEIANDEKELARLRQQKVEASIREKQVDELLDTIERTEQQRNKDLEDLEKAKKAYDRDKEILECKLLETEAILRETAERCEMLTNELSASHMTVEHLQNEISTLSDRLSQGIEENEQLYARVRELEGRSGLSAARERGRSFDSLSDLTNIDMDLDLSEFDKERMIEEFEELRGRFEKAVSEIRAMRRELREAHATQDALELEILAHRQDAARCREGNQAQVQLMAARIQDLTNKLTASEKQVRAVKQKLVKAESRDKRRSLSLKGRESFQISQELEEKLLELEGKICAIERGKSASAPASAGTSSKESSPNPKRERRKEANRSLDKARIRRKSLDSATSSEPMKVLIRLSTLETKVANASENVTSDVEKDSSECSEVSTPTNEISVEVLSRLKKLERAVAKSKRRLEKCLGSSQAEEKAEKCLREVNDILESCGECKKNQTASAQVTESVGVIVSRLESILRDKMSELTKRRLALSRDGLLDEKEKLKLIAERIAFESVIVGQLKCAMEKRTFDRCSVISELVETSQLISNLRCKVRGTKPKIYQNPSYVQYLTRVLANKLVLVGGVAPAETSKEVSAARSESLGFLMSQQQEVAELVEGYKESKLKELADALAAETLSMSEQEDLGRQSTAVNGGATKLLEDRRIRKAWAQAQETVSRELVRSEVSHVMTKCGQDYEQNITSVSDLCLNFDASERASLEAWADAAHLRLRQQMEIAIDELSIAYEDSLVQMKRSNPPPESRFESKQLLTEFADVVAQKALIDARIDTLQENTTFTLVHQGQTFVSGLIENEELLSKLVGEDYTFESNPHLDAEYAYLYQNAAKDCQEKISGKQQSKELLRSVGQSLTCLEEELAALGKYLCGDKGDSNFGWNRSLNSGNWDWPNVCEKCSELRKRVKRLVDCAQSFSCKQCGQLQETIQRLRAEHNDELEDLRRNQEKDLMDIKGELDNQRYSLTSQYEHEAATLRERARKLENRLNAMDSEHSAHVNELRAAYQRSISAELDTDAETRKRYKEEIKQLRGLCEKGLLAMENSHRRIISEMEEKHRQEIEGLRLEKEQALSEETQATLAALDAMRKAHEHEVQKEITKFKQEFIKQMQAREDIGALHKEHEEEMEEIKQEILSLSSKYSSKCVESAALEERVGSLAKQLSQAQQHILQLDARNKQLRAHIVSETNDLEINESVQLLRGRDNEIAQQREEIHRLQQQLKHGDTPRQSSGGPSKSPSLDYSPAYTQQQMRSSQEPVLRASSEDSKLSSARPKNTSSSSVKNLMYADKPGPFSYKLERIKSISLPYSNDLIRQGLNANLKTKIDAKESNFSLLNQERNGLTSPLWDSLRPRSGLPHQYQGGTTAMRFSSGDPRWQESSKQGEKQHHQETYTLRTNTRYTSRLTPEPTALSVAELTRSPSVRWSGRSCRSLPPTPTPTYHHPLHPPLPAVGMVAERKKRFEL